MQDEVEALDSELAAVCEKMAEEAETGDADGQKCSDRAAKVACQAARLEEQVGANANSIDSCSMCTGL